MIAVLKVAFAVCLLVVMFLMGYWDGRRDGWSNGYNAGWQDGLEQKSFNNDQCRIYRCDR